MIVVTVELWPHGDEAQKQHLGTARIINDGTGILGSGNYDVILSKWGKPSRKWKEGRVDRFPRLRLGPWDLLYRALRDTVGARNQP